MPQKKTMDKAAPKTATGAAAYLQMIDQGVLWTAPSGATIRVRDLRIADRATILALPEELQGIVQDIIERSDTLRNEAPKQESTEEATNRGLDLFGGKVSVALERKYELGVHLCVNGWIDPEVVPTPDDVTDPERQVPATKIPVKDRDAWLAHVFGGDEEAAQALTSFREQPSGSVATGSALSAVPSDAEPAATS